MGSSSVLSSSYTQSAKGNGGVFKVGGSLAINATSTVHGVCLLLVSLFFPRYLLLDKNVANETQRNAETLSEIPSNL